MSGSRLLRLVAITALTVVGWVATLTPAAWATPDQERAQQTIPTRTPDRGGKTPRPTQKPSPTFTEVVEASPISTSVPSAPTSIQTWTPLPPTLTETETPVLPTATWVPSPTATETISPLLIESLSPMPAIEMPTVTPFPTVTPTASEDYKDISSESGAPEAVGVLRARWLGLWGLLGGAGLVLVGFYLLFSRPGGR